MAAQSELLFRSDDGKNLEFWIEERIRIAISRAQNLSEQECLSRDIEDLMAERINDLMVEPLEIFPEQRTTQIDPIGYKSMRVVFTMPFKGDARLWHRPPAVLTTKLPRGHVDGDRLILELSLSSSTKRDVDAEFDGRVEEIRWFLDQQKKTLHNLGFVLRKRIEPFLRQRIENVKRVVEMRNRYGDTAIR